MTVRVFHNPRCSKSRQALTLLEEQGIEVKIVEYLKTPPSEKELRALLSKLGLQPLNLMRTKEAVFKELGLDKGEHSESELIRAMCEHPILIERPIIVKGDVAIVARPPEKLLQLFETGGAATSS